MASSELLVYTSKNFTSLFIFFIELISLRI